MEQAASATDRKSASFAKLLKRLWKKNRIAYLFLLPWFVGLLAFTVGPMITSFYYSLTKFDLMTPPQYVGLQNYKAMFTADPRYIASLKVTFTYVFVSVPLKLGFALLIATLMNRGLRGLVLYRTLYYLPTLLGGSVAIAVMWRKIFGDMGIVNQFLLYAFGIEAPNWVADPRYALYSIIALTVWQFGSSMIIFLAGLKQIPQDYYEASQVDGANKIRQFISITIPLLTPVIFFNLVIQLIGAFQTFTQAFIISEGKGGPMDSTLFYSLYLYLKGFGFYEMGYASAFLHSCSRDYDALPDPMAHFQLLKAVQSDLYGYGAVAEGGDARQLCQGLGRYISRTFLHLLREFVRHFALVRAGQSGDVLDGGLCVRRLDFSWKKLWFAVMMVTIMLPHHVTIIPQYILFKQLNWIDTYYPLTVPKWLATDAFFVFLMVQFIRGLPRELDESATIDGCGQTQIYWRIIMPLAVPALITTAIFTFIWTWDDFFGPLLYLNTAKLYTVQLGLRLFKDSSGDSAWGPLFAMSVLSLVPSLAIFFSCQKYFVEGISTSGIKG